MAADDIYKVDIHLEAPSGAASFGLYYEETEARDGGSSDTAQLANAFDTTISPKILAVLSDDWKFPSIEVNKMVLNPVAKTRIDNAIQVGDVTGPALPANNAMLLGFSQSLNPASSNGRIFIPGLAEGATNVGNLTTAFFDGVFLDLAVVLLAQLAELSAGSGRWDLGVISPKIRDAALPAKDWEGAFSIVTSVTRSPIIATMRKRQTKVRGRAI